MQTSEIQRDLTRFTADAEYFQEHREELLDRYPEQWVAIYRHQVVAAAKDVKRLVRQLEKMGIPSGQVYRGYLTQKDDLFILTVTADL